MGTEDATPYLPDPISSPLPPPWPDPTPAMLLSPAFEAVWQCIASWDIAVPTAYEGYAEATGNHVRAILDALAPYLAQVEQFTLRPDPTSAIVLRLPEGRYGDTYLLQHMLDGLRTSMRNDPAWPAFHLPLLILEHGMALEQLDEATMRAAGWVRPALAEHAP